MSRELSAKIRNTDPQPSVQEENDRRVSHFERSNPQKLPDAKYPPGKRTIMDFNRRTFS